MSLFALIVAILIVGVKRSDGFVQHSPCFRRLSTPRSGLITRKQTCLFMKDKTSALLSSLIDEQTRDAIVRAVMQLDSGEQLTQVHLVGEAELPTTRNNTLSCAVLAQKPTKLTADTDSADPVPCVILPLTSPSQLKLLRAAAARNQKVSKVQLLAWNSLAVNRDGGLFDNLPYASWTIDPYRKDYRDAAGNPVLERFHTGKRDAYNRMLGKDWMFLAAPEEEAGQQQQQQQSSSTSTGLSNLLVQVEKTLQTDDNDIGDEDLFEQIDKDSLSRRITELQIREMEMNLAECDYQLAVARSNAPEQVSELEQRRQEALDALEKAKSHLQKSEEASLTEPSRNDDEGSTPVPNVFDKLFRSQSTSPTPPYPGASGYRPMKADEYNGTVATYTNPYDMFREILRDQLKAEVIGAVLENSSLLEDTLTLGGALVLRRIEASKKVSIMGQSLEVKDEDNTFGNDGISGGTTFLVECDADEAIGMSLACQIPLQMEQTAWERGSVMALMAKPTTRWMESDQKKVRKALPPWEVADPELSILVEGEAGNQSSTERVAPIRVPRTTINLFDETFRAPSGRGMSSLFPTDNPVRSLQQYDEMSNDDKARTLLGMSNFDGQLPRPRVLRNVAEGEGNALDDLLLPLVDESVRNQYLIRVAEKRRDWDRVEELQKRKSRRQVAKQKAEGARAAGSEDVADWWESEAEFLASLRADPTQDEGSYSPFLDRDEWYERQRANQAKRIDRKKFGNLLDGIE